MDVILVIAIVYAAFTVVFSLWSFLAMKMDKHAAQTRQWRTSECKLHTLELLGGCFGSLSAQLCYRHKNKKMSYQIVFWFFALMHIAGIVLFILHQDEIRDYLQKQMSQ
jgi:uncharacterized membrane protein YsdA (DUF1294 family)